MINDLQQFQVFAKPIGAECNLNCHYCYYLHKKQLYSEVHKTIMDDDTLEQYIIQHIEAASASNIFFSWHGGEPTLLGLDYFKNIIRLQQKHKPRNSRITNGIQTNGTLLNDDWCRFFAVENFTVGISLDGPEKFHNYYRKNASDHPSFDQIMSGIDLLKKHGVFFEILCVVHNMNVNHPLKIYNFFKQIGAKYISFLPLVESSRRNDNQATPESVKANNYGQFLSAIFDKWQTDDIGEIKVQIFEEAARTAFDQEHRLCIFRKTCGGVPVVEHNGDFYSCDHYVTPENLVGNIKNTSLKLMLGSSQQISFGQSKWDKLPKYCIKCHVREMCNGGCPKNRFIKTPDGEAGLNYLCAGYKHFFNAMIPFVNEIRNEWLNQHF